MAEAFDFEKYRATMFDTPERDSDDPFEAMVDRVLGAVHYAELAIEDATAEAHALLAEVERLRAALVEERAARLYYWLLAYNGYGIRHEWAIIGGDRGDEERAKARAELIAEGLLPPTEGHA
jgi:hypothetical protein